MLGWIILASLLAGDWLICLLSDRGTREHLAASVVRRLVGVDASFETLRQVHGAGEDVRPVAMTRIATSMFFRLQYGIYGSGYIVMGALVVFGVPPVIVAAAGGRALGLRGAFPNLGKLVSGEAEYMTAWEPWQLVWWVAAVICRIIGVFLSLYLMFSGASMMGDVYSRDFLIAMTWGVVMMHLSSLPVKHFMRRAGKRSHVTFALDADDSTVLLLRSFSDDDISIRAASSAAPMLSPPVPWTDVRFEEVIAYSCGKLGNLVAIGRPGEALPELGAARTYWADDQWQDAIRRTALRCRAIIIIAGASDGLRWELERVRAWRVLGKCLVVLPPDPNRKRALARYAQVVELLSPSGSKLDGEPVSSWVGVRVNNDGNLTHYISDGRDWEAYAAMCSLFDIELSGGWDASALNSQKSFAEYLTDPAIKEVDPLRALRMASFGYEKSFLTLRQDAHDSFDSLLMEGLPASMLAELHQSLLKVITSWRGKSDDDPMSACDHVLGEANEEEHPGFCAFVHAVRARAFAKRGDKHGARKDAGRALDLAKSCTRLVSLPTIRVKPPEISHRAELVFLHIAIGERKIDQVVKRARRASEFAALAENRDDEIKALLTGAHACCANDSHPKAEELAKEALDLSVIIGNSWLESESQLLLWRSYRATRRMEDALKAIQRCVELFDLLEQKSRSINSRLLLASTLSTAGQPEQAGQWIRDAISRLSAIHDRTHRQELALSVEGWIDYLEEAGVREGDELRDLLQPFRQHMEE